VLLANAIFIELPFYFRRFGDRHARFLLLGLRGEFLVQDVLAQHDAIVADVNAGTGNEFLHFRVRFPAEAAKRDVCWTSQSNFRFTIFDLRLDVA
jgi:hypothetical protein